MTKHTTQYYAQVWIPSNSGEADRLGLWGWVSIANDLIDYYRSAGFRVVR